MTLEEIQRIAAKLGLDDKNIKARNIYVNWLYENFGLITMAGLVDDDAPVQVEQMYISRFFSETEVPEEEGSRTIKKSGRGWWKKTRHPVLARQRAYFITIAGLPGAGKTWLVHELALETGIRKGTPFNNTYPWIIPIPLILREYDIKKMHSLEELISTFFDQVIKKDPRFNPKDLDAFRREGQFLILLDGIDEVGPAHRKKIMAWTRETVAKEKTQNRYIVTGRPPGFKGLNTDMPTAQGKTLKLHLLPFTDEQKEEYIKKWHELRPGASEVERETKQKSLIRALADRDYLSTMARRPSFLALICFVHNNLGELPHSRATLYDKIMDAYIMQLEKVRNLSKSRPWEKGDLVFLLSRLALDWQCGADKGNYEERILSEP